MNFPQAAGDLNFDAVFNLCCDEAALGRDAEAAAAAHEAVRISEASCTVAVPREVTFSKPSVP